MSFIALFIDPVEHASCKSVQLIDRFHIQRQNTNGKIFPSQKIIQLRIIILRVFLLPFAVLLFR
jgi:hypothetical protein